MLTLYKEKLTLEIINGIVKKSGLLIVKPLEGFIWGKKLFPVIKLRAN
jgi:hypothetical protein